MSESVMKNSLKNKGEKLFKIAIVKYAGMSAGGTERYLRGLAKGLNKNFFDVTYFYCDPAEISESNSEQLQNQIEFETDLKAHGVKTIKFRVGKKNDLSYRHEWIDTDFFEFFNELERCS